MKQKNKRKFYAIYSLILAIILIYLGYSTFLVPDEKGLSQFFGLYFLLIPGIVLLPISWFIYLQNKIAFIFIILASLIYLIIFALLLSMTISTASFDGNLLTSFILVLIALTTFIVMILGLIEAKNK